MLAELREKLELAKEPGGEKAVAKRDKKGIPSARARVHALVDPRHLPGEPVRWPGPPAIPTRCTATGSSPGTP